VAAQWCHLYSFPAYQNMLTEHSTAFSGTVHHLHLMWHEQFLIASAYMAYKFLYVFHYVLHEGGAKTLSAAAAAVA